MKLNDINKLLDEGKHEEVANSILEELGEVAAEPVATADEKPEEAKVELDNKDVYNDETEPEVAEAPGEVVVEELGDAAAEPVATSAEAPEEVIPDIKNDDVYCDVMEPAKGEEVGEVVVEELGDAAAEPVATEVKEVKEAEAELNNKDVYNDKTEPEVAEAPGEVVVEDADLEEGWFDHPVKSIKSAWKNYRLKRDRIAAAKAKARSEGDFYNLDKKGRDAKLKEAKKKGLDTATREINTIKATNIEARGNRTEREYNKAYNDANPTADRPPKITTESFTDFELMQWLNENGFEPCMENVAIIREELSEDTLEVAPEVIDAVEAGNQDGVEQPIGNAEPEVTEVKEPEEIVKDTEEVMNAEDIDAQITESMNSIFALLKNLNEELGDAAAEPVAMSDEKPEEVVADLKNDDVYCDVMEPAKGEEPGEVVVKEMVDLDKVPEPTEDDLKAIEAGNKHVGEVASGRKDIDKDGHIKKGLKEELGDAAAEPVATSTEAPEEAAPELNNKDVYNDKTEPEVAEAPGEVVVENKKVSLDSLVDVITEAAKRCKAKGVKATKSAICEEARAEVEKIMGVGKEFADKEYDVDAAIESEQMNGSDHFEKYEDIQGEGANAALTGLKETAKYSSLREAYLLDEDYFTSDSYTIQKADDKMNKLTEQLALMIARDNMDPMYDTLLKEAVYTERLHEACVRKYRAAAAKKAQEIAKK